MRFLSGRIFVGLFLLLIGITMILGLLGFDISANKILSYWPLILIILGLDWMISAFRPGSAAGGRKVTFSSGRFFSGLIILLVGVFYLARKFGYLREIGSEVLWSILFAVLLIFAGVQLIRGRALSGSDGGRWAFLGGLNVGASTPWKLESGSYFAFMGGIEMDLTRAELPEAETIIDLTAIMGGINVKIPPDLVVVYEGTAILGGVSFKDQADGGIVAGHRADDIGEGVDKFLRIQARAFMGGIDIKEKKPLG